MGFVHGNFIGIWCVFNLFSLQLADSFLPSGLMATVDCAVQGSCSVVGQLRRSGIFRDYQQAFREITGSPINLRPIEAFDLPHRQWGE